MRPGQPEKRDSRQSRGWSRALRQPSKQTAPLLGLPRRVEGKWNVTIMTSTKSSQKRKSSLWMDFTWCSAVVRLKNFWIIASPCVFQDLRRNQRRIAELNSSIRKLEDRNSLLVDERNELVWKKDFSPTVSVYTVYISVFCNLSWLHPSSSPAEACSRVREAV